MPKGEVTGRKYWKCPECAVGKGGKCPGYIQWVKKPENVQKVDDRQRDIFDFFRGLILPEELNDGDLDFMLSMYKYERSAMSPAQYATLQRNLLSRQI